MYETNPKNRNVTATGWLWLSAVVIGLLWTLPLTAKVKGISLIELVARSGGIAVVRVVSVEKISDPRCEKRARIEDIASWSDTPNEQAYDICIELADPYFGKIAGNISEAVEGELALIFMRGDDINRWLVLTHMGRGRMPIKYRNGRFMAQIFPDVYVPGAVGGNGPLHDENFYQWIPVVDLCRVVKHAQRTLREWDGRGRVFEGDVTMAEDGEGSSDSECERVEALLRKKMRVTQ